MDNDWAAYAEACFTHDAQEPVVAHAAELAHSVELPQAA